MVGAPSFTPRPASASPRPAASAGGPPLGDVAEAAEDLIASANLPPPKPVESEGRRTAMAFVGPKGMKTISSLGLRTDKSPGIPSPEGGLQVVLHLDNQAPFAMEDFSFKTGIKTQGRRPYFIGLGESVGRYKARTKRSDPAQSWYVKEVALEVMRRLGERGDVGVTVFDGYGDFCNQYGGYVAAYASRVASPLELDGTAWYPRREMFEDFMSTGLASVIPGGFFIVNGPSESFDGERGATKKESAAEREAKLQRRFAREGFSGREPPCKWLMYRENNANLSVIFVGDIGFDDDTGEPVYTCQVWEGRRADIGFATGRCLDITGGNISDFCKDPPGAAP